MAKTESHCATLPHLARLNYFYGQVLGPHELRTEQQFFREKQKLHNRCLHGFGVVCGLLVEPVPAPEADPCLPGPERPTVRVDCGLALDCEGNEIVVRHPHPVDLWAALGPEGQKDVEGGKTDVFVYICFKDRPVDPARPALPDACGASSECQYGKIEDCWEIRVSTEERCDERCETCCEPCEEPCLLLARISHFVKDKPVDPADIHNGVRRMISTYRYTTITGINWIHGHTYSDADVQQMLRDGLKVQFSRPVLTETIVDGVADVWVIHDERFTEVWSLEGQIETEAGETTRWMTFRQALRERLQDGDRVLFILRSAFILDRCCRPLDGVHVGGRVPLLPDAKRPAPPRPRPGRRGEPTPEKVEQELVTPGPTPPPPHCAEPPDRPRPWTSGNGTGGITFESWFWISEPGAAQEEREEEAEERRRGGRR